MLESCVNQAAGLQGLSLQVVPRLIAVSSHGDQQLELPLLWGLCTTWVDLGFPVAVLDGHAQESPTNAGLAQLLDKQQGWISDEAQGSAWTVFPAAHGFELLKKMPLGIGVLGSLFQNYGVVLVYAETSTLTSLLKGSAAEPLLVVSPRKASSLSAYRALKHLLLDAQLRPTVANIALAPLHQSPTQQPSPAQQLQQCAMTFLGYTIKPIHVTATARADRSQDEMSRLALQMLENALPLERHPAERHH